MLPRRRSDRPDLWDLQPAVSHAQAPDPARLGTRERILAVAHDAIIAKGFDATSVEEIATAVEISRAGFFYHFPDKNALARALTLRQIVDGMILARGMGDPQVLVRQVLLARQMVKALYSPR